MHIDIITVLPQLFEGPLTESMVGRAMQKGLAEIKIHNLRDYALNKYKSVDDYAFGGEAGMVMMIEPIASCIEYLKTAKQYDEVIYMSPDGERFGQQMANRLSLHKNLIILCGHYKGVDERVREHFITKEISLGDFVMTGGEIAAAAVCDAIVRLLPGVLSDESSALSDSFQDGLVAPPVYTRPADFRGWKVPEIMTSGNQANIEKWKHEQALERTRQRRPDLLND